MRTDSPKNISGIAATLTLFAMLAAIAVLIGARWGVGTTLDSVKYISAARNFLAGKGLIVSRNPEELTPLTLFPPLYPTALAALSSFGSDPMDTARWLNAIAFGGSLALFGALIVITTRSIWLVIAASYLFVTSPPLIAVHLMAWSEPIFLLLEMAAIASLVNHLIKPGRSIVASACFTGLAMLTRYAGVALVITAILAILLLREATWRRRLAESAMFAVSALPLAMWLLSYRTVGGAFANRDLGFHPPEMTPWWPASLLLVVATGVIFWLRRPKPLDIDGFRPHAKLLHVSAIFAMSYFAMILIAQTFFDSGIPFDRRIAAPLYPFLVLVGVLCAEVLLARPGKKPGERMVLILVIASVFLWHTREAVRRYRSSYLKGSGYTSREWHESRIIDRIRKLDPNRPIFSNRPESVYLLTNRNSYAIPVSISSVPGDQLALRKLIRGLHREQGLLIHFNKVYRQEMLTLWDDAIQELALRLLVKEADGSIYRAQDIETISDRGRLLPRIAPSN